MKIISWNCNGKFRDKITLLEELEPDVLLIQECEDINSLYPHKTEKHVLLSNSLWIGENKNKGVGVYAKPGLNIEKEYFDLRYRGRSLKYFLPVKINGLHFLNVWNHRNDSKSFDYIGQFWLMMQSNRNILGKYIIAGDFNSNSIWDEWDRWWNHTDVVNELEKIQLLSVYHTKNKIKQGKEINPTFYLQRNIDKPYHIDYIFCDVEKIEKSDFYIGESEKWLKHSDHMPIIWNIKNCT